MQQIFLPTCLDAKACIASEGLFPDTDSYDILLTEGDCMVYKPDGAPLLCVRRKALIGTHYQRMYEALAPLARKKSTNGNRGAAAGRITNNSYAQGIDHHRQIGRKSMQRYQPIKRDGTISNTDYGIVAPSFVTGFVDRYSRFPYCRQTAYTNTYPDRFIATLPGLRIMNALFEEMLPERHAAQQAAFDRTHADFKIPGTVFTTMTVNRNWRTALHQDAGDLPEGFGVMACFRTGRYTGGYYVMPRYRIAVDLRAGDVIFSDVHEYHGNTALVGNAAQYERMTVVCYFREKMTECGSAQEELERAKRLRGILTHA